MKDFSYITSSSPAFIENMYLEFVKDPSSVDPELKKFFEGFDFAVGNGASSVSESTNGKSAAPVAAPTTLNKEASEPGDDAGWKKELGAYRMILGYRNKGHLIAKTNPIRTRKDRDANLTLSFFGLDDADLDKTFYVGDRIGLGPTTLKNIWAHLEKVYAGHVGIEFKYISNQEKVNWLSVEMERNFSNPVPLEKKKRILEKLNQGVMFEKFLHTKYVGQKRFSLEGGETTIAALDAIINTAADNDVQEVVIGMAHRGRLNILANIMGKTYEQIFSEFEGTGKVDQTMGSGDVKYHLGFGSEVKTVSDKTVEFALLELVDEATGGGDVGVLRIASRGESVRGAVFHHVDLWHWQTGANTEVLDDTVQFGLFSDGHFVATGDREDGGSREVVHHDAKTGGDHEREGRDAKREERVGRWVVAGVGRDDDTDGDEE